MIYCILPNTRAGANSKNSGGALVFRCTFFKYLHAHAAFVTYTQCYLHMPQELQKKNSPILAFIYIQRGNVCKRLLQKPFQVESGLTSVEL